MALPSLGETYSLLADVRTSDIKRQRDEERRYRKDARRDQLKAALLQPLVGAVATTGLEIAGNVASKVFLGDKVKSFVNSEAGRNALSAAKGNVLLKNKIDEEHKIYAAPDGINIWTNKIVDDLIAQSGATKDDEKAIIRSNVMHNKKQNQESLQAHIDDLEDKKLFLSTLPTEEQIRARAKDKNTDNFFAKSKIQKLLAKGASYLGGKSIEELMERSTNLILTGSTDSKYAPEIRETFKTSKGRQIFINLINGTLSGDDAAIDQAVLDLQDTPFYKSIATSTGLRKEQIVAFDTFYTKFNSAVSQGYEDSVYNKVLQSPDFTQVVNDKDLSKLQTLVNETIFGSADDIKNLGSNLLLDEKFYNVFTSLKTNNTAGKRENSLDLIVKDNVSFISNVLARKTTEDFNLGAYSPAVIKRGLREYLSTQITNKKITIDEDSGLLFVKELSESDRIEQLKYHIKEAHIDSNKDPAIKAGVSVYFNSIKEQFDKIKNNKELSSRGRREAAINGLENSRKVLDEALKIHKNVFENDLYLEALRGAEDLMDSMFGDPQNIVTGRLIPEGINSTLRNWRLDNQLYLAKEENNQKQPVAEEIRVSKEEKTPPSLLEKPLKFLTDNYPTDLKGQIKFLGEEIFKDDANLIKFMERLIQQESRMGQDPGTYSLSGEPGKRGSYGVAQVDEPAFDQVQKKLNKPDSTIYKYIKPFEEAIGVDLRDIQYEDLKEDILSIAIGRLYLMQHTEDPIPTALEDQGRYWKTNFNTEAGAGTPEQFVVNNQK
tara:strand:- start:5204 stop:7525 length:2322 start_codon:yes stop_codon:yes gene_type:complete